MAQPLTVKLTLDTDVLKKLVEVSALQIENNLIDEMEDTICKLNEIRGVMNRYYKNSAASAFDSMEEIALILDP